MIIKRKNSEVRLSELSKIDQLKVIRYAINEFRTSEWLYDELFINNIEVYSIIPFDKTNEGVEYWIKACEAIANPIKVGVEYKGYTITENDNNFKSYFPYKLHNGDYDSPVLYAKTIIEAEEIIDNIIN